MTSESFENFFRRGTIVWILIMAIICGKKKVVAVALRKRSLFTYTYSMTIERFEKKHSPFPKDEIALKTGKRKILWEAYNY